MSIDTWTYGPDWFVPEALVPLVCGDDIKYSACSLKTLADLALQELSSKSTCTTVNTSLETLAPVALPPPPVRTYPLAVDGKLELAQAPVYVRGFISRRRACSKKLLFWDLIDAANPCSMIAHPVCLECVVKYPLLALERVKAMTKLICMFTFVELTCYLDLNSKGELSLLVIDAVALRDNTHPSWPLHQGHTAYAATHAKTQTLPDTMASLLRPESFPFVSVPREVSLAVQKRLSAIQRLASDPTAYTNFTREYGRCGRESSTNALEVPLASAHVDVAADGAPALASPAVAPVCLGWLRDRCKRTNCPLRHHFLDAAEAEKFHTRKRRRDYNLLLDRDAFDPFDGSDDTESGKLNKTQRACVFVDWVLQMLPGRITGDVVDVAGGRGDVSFALQERGVRSTVVDPRPVKLSRRQRELVRDAQLQLKSRGILSSECDEPCCLADGAAEDAAEAPLSDVSEPLFAPPPQFQQEFHFCDVERAVQQPDTASDMVRHVLGAQLLLGMHPDQATEAIVDAALLLNIPCAVVPCCVFPSLFSHRRVARRVLDAFMHGDMGREHMRVDGTVRAAVEGCVDVALDHDSGEEREVSSDSAADEVPVVTYNQFLAYLLAKDARLQLHYLPIKGRNRVIFFDPRTSTDLSLNK